MFKTFATALTLAAGLATASIAAGTVELTDANTAAIKEKLTAEGYEVGKVKIEDGLYEAYVRKDGEKLEILLNADLEVVGTKKD